MSIENRPGRWLGRLLVMVVNTCGCALFEKVQIQRAVMIDVLGHSPLAHQPSSWFCGKIT
jgi:hypothetical protein